MVAGQHDQASRVLHFARPRGHRFRVWGVQGLGFTFMVSGPEAPSPRLTWNMERGPTKATGGGGVFFLTLAPAVFFS